MPMSWKAPARLSELQRYAVEAGGDVRLVQGAGGNFSMKVDDVMWIKASGTRLSEARDTQIFVPMRLADTRTAVLRTEDLTPYVLADRSEPGLRPSIETSLHALLPHRVVLHVHSTGAIAAGLDEGVEGALGGMPDWFDVVQVPYAKPGIGLARAVFAVIGEAVSPTALALLLTNHGLVAAADDVGTARRIIDTVQEVFAARPAPAEPALGDDAAAGDWQMLLPAGTLTEAEFAVLRLGPLTPDQAVFMGPVPFTTRSASDPRSLAAVDADGSVWLREGTGIDEAEIVRSAVDVARLVRGPSVTPLNDRQVDELINWEAEKWRRQLRR